MRVKIDRSKWLHGEDQSSSYLLRPSDSKMCCLGFCMLAIGYTEDQIRGKRTPTELAIMADEGRLPGLETFLEGTVPHVRNSPFCLEAMKVNDVRYITEDKKNSARFEKNREKDITDLLGKLGFEVEFFDGQTPSSGKP